MALYLESYLVRRMLTGRSAAGVNRALIQIANDIQEQADIADAVRRALPTPDGSGPPTIRLGKQ